MCQWHWLLDYGSLATYKILGEKKMSAALVYNALIGYTVVASDDLHLHAKWISLAHPKELGK